MKRTPSSGPLIGPSRPNRSAHRLPAAVSVLSLLTAAWLLLGPLPALGAYFGECQTLWAPHGRGCDGWATLHLIYAAIAFLVAIPSTALWVRRSLQVQFLDLLDEKA